MPTKYSISSSALHTTMLWREGEQMVAVAAGCNWKAEASLAESLQPRANDHQYMVFPVS